MRAWTGRRSTRLVLISAALGLLVAVGIPALVASAAGPARVKYYLVTETADGEVETLPEIALRLLGSEDRADDIVALNEGRQQPDGGALMAGAPLRVGWVLVLPWDAVGDGVRYGVLDAGTPATTAPPSSAPTRTAPATSGPPVSTTPPPPTTPQTSVDPSTPAAPNCTAPPASAPAGSQWAQQQMSAPDAWPAAGRGSGVVVAVVDSGVDATVPQLSGRVSAGVDVVTGTESGAVDCLGTGTAMAALIVADDSQQLLGIAPDATVVPVRVAVDQPSATATDQATAIDVAVSTGARVIAVGSYVDISLPGVRQAITNAASHDVVVVVAGPVPDNASLPPQVLVVGALTSDGELAQDYPPGTVDIVAPGQDVASLGTGSQGQVQVSGGQYAVALVAGAAALVRGASPELDADQVVEQLRTTATPLQPEQSGSGDPAGDSGAAVVNLAKAVAGATPSAAARLAAPRPDTGSGTSGATIVASAIVVVLLVLSGVLLLRLRRGTRTADPDGSASSTMDDWSDPERRA